MKDDSPRPQINASNLAVGGGVAGAIFTAGSMVIFFLGIPLIRYVFPAAIILGGVVALVLHFARHETPGASWLLSATEKDTRVSPKREHNENPPRSLKTFLDSPTAC